MLHGGPPDIKFSAETQKSPFGDIENLTKLTHDPIPPYHRARLLSKGSLKMLKTRIKVKASQQSQGKDFSRRRIHHLLQTWTLE